MIRAAIAVVVLTVSTAASAESPKADLYTTRALVTGQDERNRPLGFRLCFEDVLVKVSGDPGLMTDRRIAALGAQAQRSIASYSYRDRFEGKPKHDEQGTYDRPFFMTCAFDPAKIDAVLSDLGRKPWLGRRPGLAIILAVHGPKKNGLLARDGAFDSDMRESLAAAAERYGLRVEVPSTETLDRQRITAETVDDTSPDRLQRIAEASGADLPLVGDLMWSDAALGWVATWRLATDGGWRRWTIRGVNYDEAFRDAVRGSASVLSGHGPPHEGP